MDVNMLFTIPAEFWAPEENVVELVLGIERAVFEKPKNAGEHMKSLFIKGHLDGKPIGRMMVDEGASVKIMPLTVFRKLGHNEKDLKQTNSRLSGFSGEPTIAHEIVSKELTVGSKTVSIVFFIVDVKGRNNVLLGRDWIHANECVPSTLHKCVVRWISDHVEVVEADNMVCVAIAESQVDIQDLQMRCLTGRNLAEYDYVSVGKEGFVPISMKPMVSTTWLSSDVV
jgi:hypothetical protein